MQQGNARPRKQGLYDPDYERDACGVGFVANIDGTRSHEIVKEGLTILQNLTLAQIYVRKLPKVEAEERAMHYLERVN